MNNAQVKDGVINSLNKRIARLVEKQTQMDQQQSSNNLTIEQLETTGRHKDKTILELIHRIQKLSATQSHNQSELMKLNQEKVMLNNNLNENKRNSNMKIADLTSRIQKLSHLGTEVSGKLTRYNNPSNPSSLHSLNNPRLVCRHTTIYILIY